MRMLERNSSIDVMKFLCAFMVIMLHVENLCPSVKVLIPLCRIAVPCFFMISGYFLYSDKSNIDDKLRKAIKRIAWLCIWSTCLYALCVIPIQGVFSGNWETLSFDSLYNFVIFNKNPWGAHLWYIFAYLYTLIFLLIFRNNKFFIYFSPILSLCVVLFGAYSKILLGQSYDDFYFVNFIGYGIPCVCIGAIISQIDYKVKKIQRKTIILLCLFFMISTYLEVILLSSFGRIRGTLFLSSIPLAISFLLLAINWHTEPSWLSIEGKRNSIYIYIFHFLVTIMFYKIGEINPLWLNKLLYQYFAPFYVLGVTWGIVGVFRFLHLDVIFK